MFTVPPSHKKQAARGSASSAAPRVVPPRPKASASHTSASTVAMSAPTKEKQSSVAAKALEQPGELAEPEVKSQGKTVAVGPGQTQGKTVGPVPPRTGSAIRLTGDKFSFEPESWWRSEQAGVVRQFEIDFVSQYGQSILGGVKVRAQDPETWQPQTDSMGLFLGDDGRSTVRAFIRIRERLREGSLSRENCCQQLLDTLDHGMWVTPVFYACGDALCHVAWNTNAHAEENIKYLATTIVDHVDLVKRLLSLFDASTVWDDVKRYLLSLYGSGRRRNVNRWIAAAKALPDELLEAIRARVSEKGLKHNVSDRFVFDNPYVVGHEAQTQMRLSPMGMKAVFQQLFLALDQGLSVKVEDFQSSYCAPMKVLTIFIERTERKWAVWGACADNERWQAFVNSVSCDEGLRLAVLRCMNSNNTLDDDEKGIPVICDLVKGFKQAKAEEKEQKAREKEAGLKEIRDRAAQIEAEAAKAAEEAAKKAQEEAQEAAMKAQNEARAAEEQLEDQGQQASEPEDELGDMTIVPIPCGEDDDPVDQKIRKEAERRAIARGKVESIVASIQFHPELTSLVSVIRDRVAQKGKGQSIAILVDSGTSAYTVTQGFIEVVGNTLSEFPSESLPQCRVAIFCGTQVQGLALVVNKTTETFPLSSVFETKLASADSRSVALYGSSYSEHMIREGANEWLVTALVPPPPTVKGSRGKKKHGIRDNATRD